MKPYRIAQFAFPAALAGAAVAGGFAARPAPPAPFTARAALVPAPSAVAVQAPGQAAGWETVKFAAAQKALEPLLIGKRTLAAPGLSGAALQNFWASSIVLTRFADYPRVEVIAYDLGTRCALSATLDMSAGGAATVNGYVALANPNLKDSVPAVAADSVRSIGGFYVTRNLAAAPRCEAALGEAYGARFAQDQQSFAKLAQHATLVLAGGPAGSDEAPLTADALERTAVSRVRVNGLIKTPRFLGAITGAEHTVIVLGDPRSSVRWAAQYRNLAPGRWQFEGASDVGLTLFR